MEDILDELDDGVDIAEDLRLHGPKRQRGLGRPHDRRVSELRNRRERRGRELAGGGRPGEESTTEHRSRPRRETRGSEEDERGPGAGEAEGGGHAAREGGIAGLESVVCQSSVEWSG